MVPANRPPRPVDVPRFVPLRAFLTILALPSAICAAEPQAVSIEFLPMANSAIAVAAPDSRHLVSVYTGTAEMSKASRMDGDRRTGLAFSGQDKITRLCFFQNPHPGVTATWSQSFGDGRPQALRAIGGSTESKCEFRNWVTQVGGKVLPLGLLDVSFKGEIPPPGTPLIDAKGNVVGLILQPSTPGSAYAIPAQAVRRVQHDIERSRTLVRGWLGISLSTESSVPRITRIWPDSPAAKSGLRENDVLIKAGGYPAERYPDAVNALFYVIPGQTTSIEIMRGEKLVVSSVTPTVQKPGN